MKLQTLFKNVEPSLKLKKLAEQKVERLEKYELKPSEIKFVFSAKHHECFCEVAVRAPDHVYFRGTGLGEDHLTALERALDKLEKQLARHKSKVQFHKRKLFSHEGVLSRMNAQLDHNHHVKLRTRKGTSRAA